jgi:hypothetical protein
VIHFVLSKQMLDKGTHKFNSTEELILTAMGINTFFHELSHYVVVHTGATSPLSLQTGTPHRAAQDSFRLLRWNAWKHETCKEFREAGQRFEEVLWGGRLLFKKWDNNPKKV